jgi:hypothetical protein
MNVTKYSVLFRVVLMIIWLGFLTIGCKKNSTATTPASTVSDTTAAPATSAGSQAMAPAPAPALTTAEQSDIDARVAAARAAMQAKDYTKAQAALFVPMNRQAPIPMTGKQLMLLNDTKAAYLNQLSAAALTGDPNAKAALQRIQEQEYR